MGDLPQDMPPPAPMAPSQAYYQMPGHFVAAAVTFLILDLSAITLRFVARRRLKQALRADDWFMLLGTVFSLVIILDVIWGVSQRALAYTMEFPENFDGNPLMLVTDQMSATLKTQFIFVLTLPLALGFIKLSILIFYFRIFAVCRGSATYTLLAAFTALAGTWTVAFFFAELFQCGTNIWALTSSSWDTMNYCHGTSNIDFSLALTDFITDVVIFLVPIPLIWRINLSSGNKLAVSGVFLLGSVTIIASSIRLASIVRLLKQGFDPSMDGILVITEFLYWGMIEAGTGVLAGCTPTFQVLFRKALPWDSVLLSIKNALPSLLSKKSSSSNADSDSFHSGSERSGRSMKYENMKLGGLHHLKVTEEDLNLSNANGRGTGNGHGNTEKEISLALAPSKSQGSESVV
ncbi:hypothetical protein QBC37DRAFT_377085 [Rhypophila decipiens]|uniref:Rhodopsin domain-containing protein n=1 Tax=Rhypophila decipiens TaxID=261697 RepID=A0AAN7B6Y4_9PEZI|nr:hypothetical protein QBC37DRAFT_377085 [Rhypophila decipiens]